MKKTALTLLLSTALTAGCSSQTRERFSLRSPLSIRSIVPTYDTNASRQLAKANFGDHKFDSPRSVARLGSGDFEYVFGQLGAHDEVTINGRPVDNSQLFPYWAVKTNELSEHVFPEQQLVTLGRHDGKVRVFERNDNLTLLRTDRTYERNLLPEGSRVGNVSESRFWIPKVNFEGKMDVPYSTFVNTDGQKVVGLIGNPSYELVGGRINYHGVIFQEKLADIKRLQHGITQDMVVESQAVTRAESVYKAPSSSPVDSGVAQEMQTLD
jgi:hypothetical protein